MSPLRIAVIPAPQGQDYLANTIFDGLDCLAKEGAVEYFTVTQANVARAQNAGLVILLSNKFGYRHELAEKIDSWGKTIYIDGSELGKNNRYDPVIQQQLMDGTYTGRGAINLEMLKKCALYFRRERPYVSGILPLPFAIEERYIHYAEGMPKDIDFTCIFGQDEYPPLRREVTKFLETWCKKNNFICATKHTNSLFNRDFRNEKSQDKFYDILARTKVGVSIGGGGFDTLRFWEILANNCALLTETIGIFEEGSHVLDYRRIFQFSDIHSFEKQLEKLGALIRNNTLPNDRDEYQAIVEQHSSRARVQTIINMAHERGII